MMDIVKVAALLVLTLFAVGYALWIAVWFIRNQRPQKQGPARVSAPASRQGILGKSCFVLPPRRQPAPTAATESEDVKRAEKADIFVPGNVPQYPRQISPEKLDEVFGTPPAGESNDPEEVESPLVEALSSDYEADMDTDMDRDAEDDLESQPPAGRSLAEGVRFEKIGEAYRSVVHDNPLTEEQQQDVGQTLLGLKRTDMFEAIVSARPGGSDKVANLIDTYLTAFQRKVAARTAGSPSPQVSVPEGFDVRSYV